MTPTFETPLCGERPAGRSTYRVRTPCRSTPRAEIDGTS